MPITDRQRENRRKGVGSSDVPALFGLDSHKNAHDIYLSKVHALADDEGGPAAKLGQVAELMLIPWAAERLGVRVRRNQGRVAPDQINRSSPDALIVGKDEAIEAKTTGILGPTPEREAWGEEGTDQVPDRVILQCSHQMGVVGLARVWVPAMIGGIGLRLYCVERDERLVKAVMDRGVEFWTRHVMTQTPPTDAPPSVEILYRVPRVPNKVVDVSPDLAADYLAAQAARKQADEAEAEAKARLIAQMGDAEAGRFTDPAGIPRMARIMTIERRAYTVEAGEFKQFRITKDKGV